VVVFALVCSLFAVTPAHAAGSSISGKVTKPSGNGLADSVVDLYQVYRDASGPTYFEFEKSVKTQSDGKYSFTSLPRGTYVVGFGAESKKYAAEYWDDNPEIEYAERISLGSSAVSGINAMLTVGGTVLGRVVTDGPNPHGVAGAEVAAYRNNDGNWAFDKSALTFSDGTFAITGLTGGYTTLEFNPPWDGPDADLALEYWQDRRTFNSNDDFYVRRAETHDGFFEAALSPGGRISGRVTGPDGEPVAGAPVFSYPSDDPDEIGNVAITEDDGTYVMKGLSAGQHRLEFYGPYALGDGYISEWWDDSPSFNLAQQVTVTAGETTAGKDAQLAADGTAVVNTARPTISGTSKAGEILTADPGTWDTEHIKLTYQWLVDGSPIEGATSKTHEISGEHVGRTISVEVTASRPDYEPGRATSVSTEPVAEGALTITWNHRPHIINADSVGEQFYVSPGTWNVANPNRSYQLLIDGVEVPGATAQAGIVTPDMLGKRLSFREDVSLPGFVSASATTDPGWPIREGSLTSYGQPSFDGAAIVGEPITASNSFWDQSGQTDTELTYRYHWLVDGTEIEGVESKEFTPSAGHAGKSLTVKVTASRPGYKSSTSEVSDATTVNESGTIPITQGGDAPSISGTPRVGSTLTADAGDWKPTPSSFAYQWLAGDVEIDGATGGTFKPTATEGGKRISVKVTASRSGYAPGTATSAATEPVVSATPFGAPQNLEATKRTVTYIDLAWTKVDGAAKYRIYSGIGSGSRTKLEVGDVTSARIRNLKPNTTYSIDIAALKSDGTRSPYSPRINVKTMPLVPPINFTVTDQTSTSLTLTWTKVPGVPKYRIWHGIGSGTRTKLEVGNVGTATITGLKPATTYSIDIASLLSDGTRSSYTPRIDGTTAD
jgi:hypothetical protein